MNIPETSVPLHDEEAETAVLGSIMLDWEAIETAGMILTPDRFWNKRNKLIFNAMLQLANKNVTADVVTIINELKKDNQLEEAGGPGYIASLTDTVPSSSNIEYYANIVLDRALRRDLVKVSFDMRTISYNLGEDAKNILGEAESKVFSLAEFNESSKIYDMKTAVAEGIQNLEAKYTSKQPFTGIPSGFSKIDSMTAGFQNSDYIIIGARPSVGKTAFALSMMDFIAVQKQIPCGFFSLEMPRLSITQRLMSMESSVPLHRIRSGFMLTQSDLHKIQNSAGRIYESPLYIVDTPNMKLLDLKTQARRMIKNFGVKIIFIDYIGLITPDRVHINNWEDVAEISKSLKSLARELKIPIVVLSQLGREAEGKESNIANLRGSGAIEQDADVVMLLERERIRDKDAPPVQPAKVNIAKQRNGSTGPVPLAFIGATTKYENADDTEE